MGTSTSAAVAVGFGNEVGVFAQGMNGILISFMGLKAVFTWAGTNSGQNRTPTTTAKESRSTIHTKHDNTQRPLFFLCLGLKTGNSLSGTTSFESPALSLTTTGWDASFSIGF